MHPGELSAAVLAGGYSSRMGRDKAKLPFGDGTLLSHQTEKLRALGVGEVLLSGTAQGIPDVYPHRGPLSGIHACLLAAGNPAVLFLPVDVPLVPAAALRALIAAHTDGVTLLEHDGKIEPLIGVYDRNVAPVCAQLLCSGDAAVKNLLARVSVKTVAFEGDASLLQNCNTPEDYRTLLQNEQDTSI